MTELEKIEALKQQIKELRKQAGRKIKNQQSNESYYKNKKTILEKAKIYKKKPEVRARNTEYMKAWREKNREKYNEYHRQYRLKITNGGQ
jgi:hypothetical protein